ACSGQPGASTSEPTSTPSVAGTPDASMNPAAGPSNAQHVNPLLAPSPLSFHAPQFNEIQSSDFKPAILEGMTEQMQEIKAIADNPAAPTFQNTIVAMEQSGKLLNRALMTF